MQEQESHKNKGGKNKGFNAYYIILLFPFQYFQGQTCAEIKHL